MFSCSEGFSARALDGTNYQSWIFALKMLPKAYELCEVIEDEEFGTLDEEAQKKKIETLKWKRKAQLALSNIAAIRSNTDAIIPEVAIVSDNASMSCTGR